MTKIDHAPGELLTKIFEQLNAKDLRQCQRVCRSWSPVAQCMSLSEVSIIRMTQAIKFIKSFNDSSHRFYMVRKLTISGLDSQRAVIFKNRKYLASEPRISIQDFFLRFPYLQELRVSFSSILFRQVDEEMCKLFASVCPQLSVFEVEGYYRDHESADDRWKMRSLITKMTLQMDMLPGDRLGEYLSLFPRLKSLTIRELSMNCFVETMIWGLTQLPVVNTL